MNPPRSPIDIVWETPTPPPEPDEADLRAALQRFLEALGWGASGVSLLLAGDLRLRALNRQFRQQDQPTDVLSWSYRSDPEAGEDRTPPLLGELAVSLDRVQTQARENGWDLRTELLRLLAHGCAHLAGYDHQTDAEEQEMKAVEIRLLEGVGLSGLYPP